jgi:hypothetical protein
MQNHFKTPTATLAVNHPSFRDFRCKISFACQNYKKFPLISATSGKGSHLILPKTINV